MVPPGVFHCDLPLENRPSRRVRRAADRTRGDALAMRKRYAPEEIIGRLRGAEVPPGRGPAVGQVAPRRSLEPNVTRPRLDPIGDQRFGLLDRGLNVRLKASAEATAPLLRAPR